MPRTLIAGLASEMIPKLDRLPLGAKLKIGNTNWRCTGAGKEIGGTPIRAQFEDDSSPPSHKNSLELAAFAVHLSENITATYGPGSRSVPVPGKAKAGGVAMLSKLDKIRRELESDLENKNQKREAQVAALAKTEAEITELKAVIAKLSADSDLRPSTSDADAAGGGGC